MAQTDKMMRYYQAGIDYAHDLIRDKGLEAFEEDWRFRHKTGIITRLPVRVIDTGIEDIKRATFYTVLCMALNVLHDEFDFGPIRLKRYMDRFWLKSDCLEGGLCTWADLADVLLQECGIDSGIKDRLDEKGNVK
jgi:hypothetical protein